MCRPLLFLENDSKVVEDDDILISFGLLNESIDLVWWRKSNFSITFAGRCLLFFSPCTIFAIL